eukprot:3569521-Amphidinium_carterae.1
MGVLLHSGPRLLLLDSENGPRIEDSTAIVNTETPLPVLGGPRPRAQACYCGSRTIGCAASASPEPSAGHLASRSGCEVSW